MRVFVAENQLVALRPGGPPKWFVVFCLLFGVGLGFVTAALVMSFWTMMAGEEADRGLFVLVWMVAGVIFFAWPMHIVARARAVRRQRQVMRERIGDLDYEPPTLPMLGERAPGPKADKDELEIKAPDIGSGKLRTFLARGRTAEQRMADHLKSLELQAEMKRAKESKAKGQRAPDL